MSFPDLTAPSRNVAYAVPVTAAPVHASAPPANVPVVPISIGSSPTPSAPSVPYAKVDATPYASTASNFPPIPPIPAPLGADSSGQNYPFATVVQATAEDTSSYGFTAGVSAQQAFVGAGSFDRSFFAGYDQIAADLRSLEYVDQAIQDTEKNIKSSSFKLERVKHNLFKLRKSEKHLAKRVSRNENPRFLHYLQFNRHEKVQRLKGEYNELKAEDEKLLGESQALDRSLRQLKQQKNNHIKQKQRRDGLEQQRQQLFNQVVDSQPPTPMLRQVDNNIALQNREIQRETMLLNQVDEVISRIRLAEQHYSKSIQLLQRAQRLNAGE